MANKIILKKTSTASKVPLSTDLDVGELAVNLADAKLYTKDAGGTVIQLGGGSGSGDVVGPSSATDNALARFDTTTGKLIQNGVVTQDDNGTLANVNAISMDTTPTSNPTSQGAMYWDTTYNTLSVQMDANTHAHVGQSEFFYAKASSAISIGQLCYFTGTVGASGVIQVAPAISGITNAQYIVGIASENIALNGFGYIQTFGILKGFNTSGWASGTILYYDSTNGGLTSTYPTSGIIFTVCAVVNSGSGGSGSVAIRPSATQRITQGTGITVSQTVSGTSVTNSGVTSAVAGTGISVSGATGAITVTNTAPDQTVVLTAGTGISTSGTYPNFTISNTGVTSVGATAPIASSGGATPTISISQATASTNGYLSSTDWNTFNGKWSSGTALSATTGSFSGLVTATGGSKISVQAQQDGGTGRGLYIWDSTDANWVIYMGQAGAGKSASGGTAASGLDGRTAHAIRYRANNSATQIGFLWENSSEVALMQLQPDTGNLYTKGSVIANGTTLTGNTGTVTSVGGTGTVAGISLSGTVTTSGNLTLGGTFALPSGQVPTKMVYDTFTATASQTTFTSSTTYTASKIEVYVNGVKMRNGTDVTVTSGTSVVFATGLAVGSLVDLVYPT